MDILMSIRPAWVACIRSGSKRAELRRRPVPAETARIFVYETKPAMRICGWLEELRVEVLPLEELWVRTKDCSCVARTDFDAYYAGLARGAAIFFGRFQAMHPVPVDLVARRPPQSWMNLSPGQSAALLKAGLALRS